MGEKDAPKKSIAELRKNISNPLSPKYVVANEDGKSVEIGEISGQRPKQLYQKRSKLSDRDNMYCSMTSIEWKPVPDKYHLKLKQITSRAGANSQVCNNGTYIIDRSNVWGKKKYMEEINKQSLEGILQTPKQRRIHIAAKPPVYKQPRKKMAPKKKTQIIF